LTANISGQNYAEAATDSTTAAAFAPESSNGSGQSVMSGSNQLNFRFFACVESIWTTETGIEMSKSAVGI
jgi:hypothetical protein